MSTNIPNWDEFSWAAFLYGAIGGDKSYQNLMKKTNFLQTLRNNPNNLKTSELRTEVIAGFLNRWRCRIENNNQAASDLKNKLQMLSPFLNAIMGLNIITVIFNAQKSINGKKYTIEQIIKELYSHYRHMGHRFGPVCSSKLLHILQPDLFVMWDNPIINHYQRNYKGISGSSQGYINFLNLMQSFSKGIYKNFINTQLTPKKSPNQTPENYLSINMGYSPLKSMAKYLDEHNWVTITNNVHVPPKWHP